MCGKLSYTSPVFTDDCGVGKAQGIEGYQILIRKNEDTAIRWKTFTNDSSDQLSLDKNYLEVKTACRTYQLESIPLEITLVNQENGNSPIDMYVDLLTLTLAINNMIELSGITCPWNPVDIGTKLNT